MAKEADKEVKSAQEYIRKLNIVSTKGPQANAPTDFIEEKADPQVSYRLSNNIITTIVLIMNSY